MSYRFNLNLWPHEFIEGCASIAAKRRLNIDSVILSIILGTTVFVGKSQIRMVGSDKVDVASLWICNVQVGFSIEAAAAAAADADAAADKQTDINQTNTHTQKKEKKCPSPITMLCRSLLLFSPVVATKLSLRLSRLWMKLDSPKRVSQQQRRCGNKWSDQTTI